ncbi:hypothetical protein BC936DRAFT_141258 [Jimgerdemannia flammicorona]|uniref:Uncharacterized protein n=1 Tax=Jimgerdemannia flammicorona TaxID=994334 RepID=A0A433DG75_9FUNG|nr:hypothetical protein BC936DRAFT_141258 [Jimgerdemannia flammicorona]
MTPQLQMSAAGPRYGVDVTISGAAFLQTFAILDSLKQLATLQIFHNNPNEVIVLENVVHLDNIFVLKTLQGLRYAFFAMHMFLLAIVLEISLVNRFYSNLFSVKPGGEHAHEKKCFRNLGFQLPPTTR